MLFDGIAVDVKVQCGVHSRSEVKTPAKSDSKRWRGYPCKASIETTSELPLLSLTTTTTTTTHHGSPQTLGDSPRQRLDPLENAHHHLLRRRICPRKLPHLPPIPSAEDEAHPRPTKERNRSKDPRQITSIRKSESQVWCLQRNIQPNQKHRLDHIQLLSCLVGCFRSAH